MVDDVLMLGDGEIIFFTGFFNAKPGGRPWRARSANEIRIETRASPNLPRSAPAVSQMQCDGVVGVAWNDHDSGFGLVAAQLELYVVARRDVQMLRSRGTDHRRVVPGQSCVGFGGFLQPPVIGETAVED